MQLTQPFVLPSYFSPHPAPSSSHVFTWKGFAHPRGNTLKWGSPLGAGCVRVPGFACSFPRVWRTRSRLLRAP
ncbi:hypothetical protein Y1Q_0024655 [Alligator mississippiensis]|uniref:Uncharacterized protein n=1 Tax=Alligator mississippiensis TaxID=8496 RepID=A0A151NB83_ALLMI|nr:hypothetical protein Y1Q_0024655 [Alligator mississippiensis]